MGARCCRRAGLPRAPAHSHRLAEYFRNEYDSQVRRHAFYEDLNHGGKTVVTATHQVAEEIGKPPPKEAAAKVDLDDDAANLKHEQLRAMGADLTSVHAATGDAATAITADLKARRGGWLHDSARERGHRKGL
jgi:hypothetical protein